LFHGNQPHNRKYLVQVINKVTPETIAALSNGITISAKQGEKYITNPCEVSLVDKPAYIQELSSTPLHKNVKNSWLTITLTEGKFHQVRKMVAAVNHKCLRLIRISIEDIEVEKLKPGEVQEVSHEYFFEKLKL
jgi:23S rRNA pseudouridine2457 synthase